MATYYNRLHNAGEVDFAKHGCKGDGTISDLAKFEDAFAVALDRGLNCLVSPAGRTYYLPDKFSPPANTIVDLFGSTILTSWNRTIAGGSFRRHPHDGCRWPACYVRRLRDGPMMSTGPSRGKIARPTQARSRRAGRCAGKARILPRWKGYRSASGFSRPRQRYRMAISGHGYAKGPAWATKRRRYMAAARAA
jgi:hypothetical protein